jgi:hypothetical protein
LVCVLLPETHAGKGFDGMSSVDGVKAVIPP